MERKINYQKELYKTLDIIKDYKTKPRLLLHACCGPCFTIPYDELKDYFDITIIFNNSNIYPKSEHDRRLDELKRYIKELKADIKIIEFDYDNLNYNKDLLPYAEDKEGHERCRVCFKKRLSVGYDYASENNYDYFGTVMTISRYKNAQDINKIGRELEETNKGVKWLYADFKKNDGYEHSLLVIKAHEMYFQEYCGCVFSYKAYQEKHKDDKQD